MKTSIYNIRTTFAREMTIDYLFEKFSNSFDKSNNGCWQWNNSLNKDGYGQVSLWGGWKKAPRGGQYLAHRVMYELIKRPLDKYEQLDHLCKNIICINPNHLEAVDKDTNNLRGNSPSAIHARKTQCPKGHPYTAKWAQGNGKYSRSCLECNRIKCKEYYYRKKQRNIIT